MTNWTELGEVPDSEEEDGFDSQEVDTTSALAATKTPTAVCDADIWDFPGSDEDEDERHRPRRPGQLTVLVPGPSFDVSDSSPLSSAPSEQDLPPVDQLILSRSYFGQLGSSELGGTFAGASSSQEIPKGDETQSPAQVPAEKKTSPLPSQGLGGSAEDQEAGQAAIRYERSLRPRKPIQQHPYLLENAQYSSLLKEHDVRPLRMAREDERRRREQTLQDDDFEEDSQEAAQRGVDESQSNVAEASLGAPDDFEFPSSSPPKASPLNDNGQNSSQTSSHGDTDDTSILGQDLPALEELLSLPPRLVSRTTAKRQATPPPSTIRKRRRVNVLDSDPAEPNAVPRRTSDSPDPLTSPSRLVLRRPSPRPTRSPQPEPQSPEPVRSRPFLSEPPAPDPIIDVSSDDEGNVERANVPPETQDSSNSGGDSESDAEVVNTIGRRIKGVLPASWLRLDQQSGRDKAQKDAKRRQRRRSPERESRRGVAQSRQALPGSASTQLLFVESDESEGEAPARLEATDDPVHSQTRLMLEPGPAPDVSEQAIWDDADSIVEDDHIDFMLPGKPGKKRQLKLPRSLQGDVKRPRATKGFSRPQERKLSKQPKITSHLHLPQGSSLLKKPRSNGRGGAPGARKSKSPTGNRAGRSATRLPSPPRLSILDVIEPGAPEFLKIAARTAKRRQNQGRSSPREKTIHLATRQDHLDAVSALRDWRAGSIRQRPAVTAASKLAQKQRRPQPLEEGSGNRSSKPRPPQKPPTSTTRTFVKQVSDGGSVSYQQHGASRKAPAKRPPRKENDTRQARFTSARPAQLEMDEGVQARSPTFHARKRLLDRLYRNHRLEFPLPISTVDTSNEIDVPSDTIVPSVEPPELFDGAAVAQGQPPTTTRFRKSVKPRRLDTGAPQYSHANDPLPVQYSPEPEPTWADRQEGKLLGLGPYGTNYTHHFEIFPLDPRVYFHESTLIGSGMIESCAGTNFHEKLLEDRPRVCFNLGNQILRWGPWDSQVSSELGIVLDFVAEQMEAGGDSEGNGSESSPSVDAATFILSYVADAMSLSEEEKAKSFAARTHECLSSFNERISLQVRQIVQGSVVKRGLALKVYERLLLATLVVLKICRFDPVLMAEQFHMEELLKDIAKTLLSILSGLGASQVRKTYEDLNKLRVKERGLRDDTPVIHSWVVVMKILEMSHIPRASFWELAQTVIASPQAMSGVDARDYERSWETLFTLLPLAEFNNTGVVMSGRRHDTANDGWAIPQRLLKRVFQLYKENSRQSPSFNNYCRALVGRCHYLVQQWGWRRSATVVGVIFDFFGSQDLAHLRNEEVYESARFLEELASRPTLDVEPNDNCFHIFLKLVALSIRKLREVGATKDIRNLVARTIPNHNRQHLKDQEVHARDLAALRNHHDLLATLFWASPVDLRPAVNLIERLVVPASSHKEACLINIRCWNQLARFIVASGEATTSFKAFGQWRNMFLQHMLRQFDSVASDVQQQLRAMAKDISKSISEDMINATILRNKATVMDVLHASAVASLDVMRHAPDLEAATFSLSTPQLQSVFKQFAVAPPELDWGILRASLATLDAFLCKVDEFKDGEESQQSESQILNSAQADDAIMVVDHEISSNFFSMARCVLSSRRDRVVSAMARFDKSNCTEHIVALSARMGLRFINCGIMRLSDMFKVGKYGLFERAPRELDLDQRRYLALFASTLLKHGLDDFSDAGFSLSELWVMSLVKPREYLGYETQLAEQLHRHGIGFVPDAVVGLAIRPDYNTNRDLFEFAISNMRKSIRDAGPALEQILKTEYSKTLKLVMELIKGDLKTVSHDASSHHGYVTFVQDIISLIKTHGICAVDNFFYQISKEYSPSAQDPQLRVAGLISYGLRLKEDDDKSGHGQQLFHLLFNNVKFSMINDKLRGEVGLLRKGMKNQGIIDFVLGKMLPAIIRASLKNSSGFPLMDVYAEALRLLFTRKTVAYELSDGDLPQVAASLHAAIAGMDSLGRSSILLSDAQLHMVRQVMGVLNLLWPSLYTLSASGTSSPAWAEISKTLERIQGFASTAETYLRGLVATGDSLVQPGQLFAGISRPQARAVRVDPDVNIFTENIVQDIAKNWSVTAHRITIQTPESNRGAPSTPGLAIPAWDMSNMLKDLHDRTREWCWWWQKVYGVSSCIEGLESVRPRWHFWPCHCRGGRAATTMASLFRLPDEVILTPLLQRFPGREHQIRSLATLLHPDAAPCRNLVVHGTEATGKSAITAQLLARLAEHTAGDAQCSGLKYAAVNAAQCVTGRHLFERIVGAVGDAQQQQRGGSTATRRCETLAQLAVALGMMLGDAARRDPRWRFVLVLDAVDRQRDAPPTLLPALARLSEIVRRWSPCPWRRRTLQRGGHGLTRGTALQIPCLTCVFIVTAAPAGLLRTPASAHLHFPPYTKPEFVRILSLAPPPPVPGATPQETADLWTRFCAAVHDAFVRSASRTLPSFRDSCRALWPRFTAPVVAGTHSVKEFSKLLVAARGHFQDEALLNPGIVSVRPGAAPPSASATTTNGVKPAADLTALLPIAARLLLLSAYLASHNAVRHDLTLFSTYHHGRKRRRRGAAAPRTKHRKIARKLLGAHAFVLERMLAVFEAVRGEWAPEGSSAVGAAGLDGDVGMAIATLASLRLLVRVGAGDVMDRAGKWRINVGWEAIRGIGRSIGVEVEEWLIE
ncbi:Protein mms22 [Tolypocladium paradoxum]|uniref:Protein mms22 n=1 Tax=Tolypocladium paradoxum TaxID=94208 RepID=A0A2S4L5S1_9HYPO|nr:Protein mms22 [Tolypocladium paradoxum]